LVNISLGREEDSMKHILLVLALLLAIGLIAAPTILLELPVTQNSVHTVQLTVASLQAKVSLPISPNDPGSGGGGGGVHR
jgi:hypothetical protein